MYKKKEKFSPLNVDLILKETTRSKNQNKNNNKANYLTHINVALAGFATQFLCKLLCLYMKIHIKR
jgi:hypothetical protein